MDAKNSARKFARSVREFVPLLPKTPANYEDFRQLIRSSGSIGANYIEASASLGRKDFYMKMKIARKEAKESVYWLQLLDVGNETSLVSKRNLLVLEGTELMRIFGSIVTKSP
jgi:four helix bundle protein